MPYNSCFGSASANSVIFRCIRISASADPSRTVSANKQYKTLHHLVVLILSSQCTGPTQSMPLGLVETCRARTSLADRAGSCSEGHFMLPCSSVTRPLFPASIHIVLFTRNCLCTTCKDNHMPLAGALSLLMLQVELSTSHSPPPLYVVANHSFA